MLCKKCNTFVSEEDMFCKNCGKNLKRKRVFERIASLFFLVAAICACGIYIYLSSTGKINIGGEQKGANATVPVSPSRTPTGNYPTATPVHNFMKDINEINDLLTPALESVLVYMKDSGYEFISYGGYLYNYSEKRIVTASNLIQNGKLGKEYENENVFFLYLKPSDFKEFDEIELNESDEMTVFAAFEVMTGVVLYNPECGCEGTVYRENLNSVLTKYNQKHGEITRPLSNETSYVNITAAIQLYLTENPNPTIKSGFNIRFLSNDDFYGIAVISPVGYTDILLGYALEKTEDGYAVVYANFEDGAISEVNRIAPALNIGLFPDYDVASAELLPQTELYSIIDELIYDGKIDVWQNPIMFAAGNSRYLYVVLSGGDIYLGTFNNTYGWDAYRIGDWATAESMLARWENDPPLFIIMQE